MRIQLELYCLRIQALWIQRAVRRAITDRYNALTQGQYYQRRLRHLGVLVVLVFTLCIILVTSMISRSALNTAQPTSPGIPTDIAVGRDGSLWLAYYAPDQNKIRRVRPDGIYTDYYLRTPYNSPYRITTGPDGALWFTQPGIAQAGSIDDGGTCRYFPLEDRMSIPLAIAAGPYNAIWVAVHNIHTGNSVIKIEPNGSMTIFPINDRTPGLLSIAAGHNNTIWLSAFDGTRIVQLETNGETHVHNLPQPDTVISSITAGPDDAMWFAMPHNNRIGRITTSGSITQFALPTANAAPTDIVTGSDGFLWFTEHRGRRISRISTDGYITQFPLSIPSAIPLRLAAGSDNRLWFTYENLPAVGHISPDGTITHLPLDVGNVVSRVCSDDPNVAGTPSLPTVSKA
jgi:streptogramin lyase